ncbi:MAG: prepilin-type N-terminal cleavage/methylation domain-containing protein [Candidatus Sumerlaeota bacterium]|nr:prepilin-type N-terminal cleavage/methylation domain-containing protein [Candidatus Sumerlaeota bacterium]
MFIRNRLAFTLLELLIVVAIIAVLAAIAVPNFNESSIRAKAARARADMKTIATAIELYRTDNTSYPPPYGVVVEGRDSWAVLSTPCAYLSTARTVDPFAKRGGMIAQVTYTYEPVNNRNQIIESSAQPPNSVAPEGQSIVWWWVASRGPDSQYGFKSPALDPEADIRVKFHESDDHPDAWLSVVYDPTNGPASLGNLYRAGGMPTGYAGRTMLW